MDLGELVLGIVGKVPGRPGPFWSSLSEVAVGIVGVGEGVILQEAIGGIVDVAGREERGHPVAQRVVGETGLIVQSRVGLGFEDVGHGQEQDLNIRHCGQLLYRPSNS